MATIDILVVAGGGGGGNGHATIGGGGGGAGGVRVVTGAFALTGPVVVGDGGAGAPATVETPGARGQDSSYQGIVALGGGGGATFTNTPPNPNANGGSGGGGVWNTVSPGTGTAGQGNSGGAGTNAGTAYGGGGGGGGSAAGGVGTSTAGGNGGAGVANDYSGTSITYGGGGGGGASSGTAGVGTGGGGNGGLGTAGVGSPGVANRGGGGGGGSQAITGTGGAGGRGVVIIRYLTGSMFPTGGVVTTSGPYTIHTFTTTGVFTAEVAQNLSANAGIRIGTVPVLIAPFVVFDTATNQDFGIGSWGHVCTTRADRVLLVAFSGSSRPTSVTYAGVAMTLFQSIANPQTLRTTDLWILANPAAGVNNVASSGGASFVGHSLSYSGVDLADLPHAWHSKTDFALLFTDTVTTTVDQCLVVMVAESDGTNPDATSNSIRRTQSVPWAFAAFESVTVKTPAGVHGIAVTGGGGTRYFAAITIALSPKRGVVALAGAAAMRIAATAAVGIASRLAGAAAVAVVTSGLLTMAGGMSAASAIRVSSTAALTAPAGFRGGSGIQIGTVGVMQPTSINGAAGFRIGTAATMTPSPRSTAAGITIGGVDVRRRVRMAGLTVRDILNDAPNTCTFTLQGDRPAVGQAVRVTLNDGLVVLFAGTIQAIDHSYEGSKPALLAWSVRAIDDTARANARRPFGTWVDTSATTIALALTAGYAPAFSTAGIETGLPTVSIVFDGSETVIACLSRLATAIGGYCKVEDGTIFLFTSAAAVDPLDDAHPFLNSPAIKINTDASQLRTRVFGKGYGEKIITDVGTGETLVPIQDGVQFTALGGSAIAATTADGAQSEKLTYAGVELQAGGTLVGPGASPGNAPLLALAAGAGVTSGVHDVGVVFVTAAGKSKAGPVGTIKVGTLDPPAAAPTAAVALSGTGPDQGSHDYAVAFVTAFGDTVPGPIGNAITTSAAVGQLAAPPYASPDPFPTAGNGPDDGMHFYAATFVNAVGETTLSPDGYNVTTETKIIGATPPVDTYGPTGTAGGTTGGNLTPNTNYRYQQTFTTASGESVGNLSGGSVLVGLGAAENACNVPIAASSDLRVTGRKLYRQIWPAGNWHLCGTIANNTATTHFDTASDASIASAPAPPTVDTTANPGTPTPYRQVTVNVPTGAAGTTARRLYRRSAPYATFKLVATLNDNTTGSYLDTKPTSSLGVDGPVSNTTGTAFQKIPVSNIPIGPLGVTSRKLFRRFNGAGTFKLVTTIANNTATTFTDAVANAALGAAALSVATAIGNQIAVTSIPKGSGTVTSRELYMSVVGNPALKLALVIPDNVTETATLTASDATLTAAAAAPVADTSGLTQPPGQVNPGSIVLPVAASATFRPGGGWVALAGGQVARYTGISGQTLTGIPAAGAGSIQTTVLYGSQALPAAMLTGVTGIVKPLLKGSAIHIWLQRDDVPAQAEHAARTGGDGVVEYLITDARRAEPSLADRVAADLALFSRPIVAVAYATRDLKTKSGRNVTVVLPAFNLSRTLTIQDVTITEIDLVPGLPPRFSVNASSVRFSLEDTLRQLIAAPK